jgi:hypothetical protein
MEGNKYSQYDNNLGWYVGCLSKDGSLYPILKK